PRWLPAKRPRSRARRRDSRNGSRVGLRPGFVLGATRVLFLIALGLARAFASDRFLAVPERIGARQFALHAAGRKQRERREGKYRPLHSNISFQRSTCSRTRCGAVPP